MSTTEPIPMQPHQLSMGRFQRAVFIFLSALISLHLSVHLNAGEAESNRTTQIAFLPDIHFHDVYGEFQDGSFAGVKTTASRKRATIRTMQAQLTSTRLFNENYFALLAALDDIAARGIKLVAIPGDFSDDGQPVHMRGLRKILQSYADNHGIEFFAAPGNHDPVRPFDSPGGEPDFLGPAGQTQRIFSKGAQECQGYAGEQTSIKTGRTLNTICTEEIRHLGYQGVIAEMAKFGFFPKSNYLYWETPYTQQENYNFAEAVKQAELSARQYEICHQGTGGSYRKAHYTNCHQVPDASYLVEPVPGLWLLAIDANVYVPTAEQKAETPTATTTFSGSGNAGYNKMATHKAHVLEWIADVVKRAHKEQKQLIAFSHFPMAEFYDGQSDSIAGLFGESSFQLTRRPDGSVSQALADTGLQLHVGGHMHMNDTGVIHGSSGNTLFNIQAPSMAAYLPAYKILTLSASPKVEVQTVVLNKVPRFNELFEHYHQEHKHLQKTEQLLWDERILASPDYSTFTTWHLRELTRLRFLPQEWPEDLKQLLFTMNGEQLLVLPLLPKNAVPAAVSQQQWQKLLASPEWQEAKKQAAELAREAGLNVKDFVTWTGFDLATDFYRLRNAGELAMRDIGKDRLSQYRLLAEQAQQHSAPGPSTPQSQQSLTAVYHGRFTELLTILQALQQGEPDDHFVLDLAKGNIAPTEK